MVLIRSIKNNRIIDYIITKYRIRLAVVLLIFQWSFSVDMHVNTTYLFVYVFYYVTKLLMYVHVYYMCTDGL